MWQRASSANARFGPGPLIITVPADDAVHLDADDILAMATVHDLVIGSRLAFEDRGTHMLKGIDTPWPIVAAIANRDPPTHAP